jgi:anti-sigma B factor antagonist
MAAKKKDSEEKNRLEIGGELTIYVAAELKKKIGALLSAETAIEIDLAQVSEIDSAGLQLLLLVQREGAQQQKSIVFRNPSTAVLDCWRLCNVSALFGAGSAAA